MNKSLIIIPTYNEVENIVLMIKTVFEISDATHLLIVDDSSPDGTANKVKSLQVSYSDKLFLLQREKKEGSIYCSASVAFALNHLYYLVSDNDAATMVAGL